MNFHFWGGRHKLGDAGQVPAIILNKGVLCVFITQYACSVFMSDCKSDEPL